MSALWLRGLLLPALLILLALVAWLLAGPTTALLLLGLGVLVLTGSHIHHLAALARWASSGLDDAVPEGRGAWAIVYEALYRRVKQRSARQRDLRMALDRFLTGAQALPDGIVVLDARNHIRWANARAAAHLGVLAERDTGAAVVNLVRQPSFLDYLAAEDHSEPVTIQSSREAGSMLSVQIVPFGVEEKLVMTRDITRIEAVERVRRDFIANVSHELRTPLTVLTGFLETLAELELSEEQRKRYIKLMEEQAQSMQRLVADLLTLSSLESGQAPSDEREFPVAPLLEQLAGDARALSGGRHEITVLPAEASVLRGNRDELASAFGNLLSNAVRYTPTGGHISLGWTIVQGRGELSVSDDGIGIEAEHIPRLTERFYRVDRSRSRATGGTGLGLAIVKHVLLRHQAELDVQSEPGRGSVFTVILPRERVKELEPPMSEAEADDVNRSRPGSLPESALATSNASPP